MTRLLNRNSIVVTAIAGLIVGCGGEPSTPTAATVSSGSDQAGVVGQPLAAPIVVQVADQNGAPMSAVAVSFSVVSGGGTVSPPNGSTNESGQASANWTLGTTAGESQQVRATVTDVSGLSATFNATAAADEPFVITMVSGDAQFAFTGTKLDLPMTVRVRDQYANDVAGQVVAFTVPTGRGSVDSAVAFTNTNGVAVSGWTVGGVVGLDSAHATVAGVTGSPVIFTATVHNLQVSSVTPSPIVLGGTATLTGSGFSTTAANNTVMVGDLTAVVNSATATSLQISIPAACRPLGNVAVQVTVAGVPSTPVSAQLTPTSFLNLAEGEQAILQDPNDFCIQFAQSSASESYLIGVQSATEASSSRTPVLVTSVRAASASPAPFAQSAYSPEPSRFSANGALQKRHMELYARHRVAEARILSKQLDLLSTRTWAPPRAAGPSSVPQNVQVDDTVDVRVSDNDDASCATFTEVRAVVRAVGDHGVWVDDIANPADGFTSADFQSVSDLFDETTFDVTAEYFGAVTDMDANDRTVFVVTQQVNLRDGPAGFVSPVDFLAQSGCAASNEGEYVYLWTPDSTGTVGFELPRSSALEWLPTIAAHEFVHVLQVGRRTQAAAPTLPSLWEMEGQATLGEEVVGHAVEGNAVAQNLNNEIAFDFDEVATSLWYYGSFYDLFFYYGMDDRGEIPIKIAGAPEDCSWLAKDIGHVCLGDLLYSPSWSLLRWLSDRYASTFAGGEKAFQRALIDNTGAGFDNIETVLESGLGVASVSMDTLLAQWAAMLYVDDRQLTDGTLVQADPELTMSSWNLFSVFDSTAVWGAMEHTLVPRERSFADFSDNVNVRAASTAYFIVAGDTHAATAIRARDSSDQALPSHMQVWIVRMN